MEERAQLVQAVAAAECWQLERTVDEPSPTRRMPSRINCKHCCRIVFAAVVATAMLALVRGIAVTRAQKHLHSPTGIPIHPPVRPHILLFEADQVRPDAHEIGRDNDESLTAVTPNLDGLASEGVRFTRAYSSTPICTPARLALLTGRSTARHGLRAYRPHVPSLMNVKELVSTLAEHGYATAVVGKNHYGVDSHSLLFRNHGYAEMSLHEGLLVHDRRSHGFVRSDDYGDWFESSCPACDPLATSSASEAASNGTRKNGTHAGWRAIPGATPYNSAGGYAYPYPEELHPTRWTADAALRMIGRWLERRHAGDNRPLFLKCSFHRPHSPYDPPVRWLQYMLDRWDRIASPAFGSHDARHAAGHKCSAARREYCGPSCGFQSYCGHVSAHDGRMTRAHYLASLSFVDEQIGRILDKAKSLPHMWQETFVLYVSDHGDAMGDHHLWRKGYPYEQVASVPLYARWPASMEAEPGRPAAGRVTLRRGASVSHLVELRDIFPTLADVAGIHLPAADEDPSAPDGRSLLPLLGVELASDQHRSSPPWRETVMLELAMCNFDSLNWVALTDGATKYVRSLTDGKEELYDLTSDSHETNDLSGQNGSALDHWRSRLADEFQREQRGPAWVLPNGTLPFGIGSCEDFEVVQTPRTAMSQLNLQST